MIDIEKAKAYCETIKRANEYCGKSEESERIRQNCIHFLELQKSHHAATFEIDECIAWLEEQRDKDKLIKELCKYKVKYTQEVLEKYINSMSDKDENIYCEQKPTDKVSPKFKIGDWIVYNRTDNSREIMQIHDIRDNRYYFTDNIHFSWSIKECDEKSHLWTIQDAKDGDVLFQDLMSGKTFIYNGINPDMAILYSFIINNDGEDVLPYHIGKPNTGIGYIEENKNIIHPATKEQRSILFQKVHEAGYEWNDKRKKLRKINQKGEKIMAQYIDKNKVEDILSKLWKEDDGHNPEHRICYNKALQEVQCELDTLEVKETELQGIEKEVAEGHVGLVDKKRVPIELKGELKAKFKNEFNTLWQIVHGIQFANVAKHIVERICLNFAIWGAYNLKIGQTELTEINDESEDERVRKYFIAKIKKMLEEDNLQPLGTVDASNLLAWLEKQEEKKPLYIRFGDVPSNESSKIYRGEVEIGEENGVSVYPAFITDGGNIVLGLTLPITKTTLYTQQHLLEYDNRPCYLVSGDYVGKGTDGEPLIRNISIIKRLDDYRVKEKKQGKQETLCDKCRKEHPSHSCQDITELGRCAVEHEQKLADMIKPKFHEGDWIVFNGLVLLINEIVQGYYRTISIGGIHHSYDWDIDNVARLWSIADAKDGDILAAHECYVIFKEIDGLNIKCHCTYHYIGFNPSFHINTLQNKTAFHPATKEQRDTLMKAMADARYTFDFEKKELNKIEKQCQVKESTEIQHDNKTCKENDDSLTNEGGKIRKEIEVILANTNFSQFALDYTFADMIAWLEKQGIKPQGKSALEAIHEQNPDNANKVERKFKVGDYIVNDYCKGKVIELTADAYLLDTGQGIPFSHEHNAHLWTIADAKDGDVLVNDEGKPFIFKGLLDAKHPNCPVAYGGVCINCDDVEEFCISERCHWWCDLIGVKPATKEQRDALMKAMADARYTFDFEKKELNKIEKQCQVKESTEIQHNNKTCKENGDSLTDDERIKGEIIDFIYDKTDTYELREKSNSWLTWLEKQGIKPLGQVEDKTELAETEDNKVITDWSEEDKKMFRSLHNLIYVVRECDCSSMEKDELSDWLESIKDRVQPKQEWSEEDEYLLGETIQHLEELIRIDKAKHCACDVQYYQRDIDWLKSLKERAVWKQRNYNYERK